MAETSAAQEPGEAPEDLVVEEVILKTEGDRRTEQALTALGGKGVFVKEIEDALLAERIDLAVHSMKDMPTETPRGLGFAAVPLRHDQVPSECQRSLRRPIVPVAEAPHPPKIQTSPDGVVHAAPL